MIILGDMTIDNSNIPEIGDFTADEDAGLEYIKQNMKVVSSSDPCQIKISCKINRIEYFKIVGIWYWVAEMCPNKRVVHLMNDHKDKRVRLKNFKRACRILDKYLCERI